MNNRNIRLMLLDAVAAMAMLYLAFLIRFEFVIPKQILDTFFLWIPWFVIIQITVFYFSDLYARIWRYTSLFDLYAIIRAVTIVSAISVIFTFISMGSVVLIVAILAQQDMAQQDTCST